MATINGSTNNPNWTYKLEVTEGSYSIQNNTSSVTVNVYLGRASSTSYLGGNWSGSVTVDGQTQNMSGNIPYPTYINGGAWLLLTTKTFTVQHNNDGSKTANVSSSFYSGDFTPSSASASGSVVLTKIPRQSNLTFVGDANSGNITDLTIDTSTQNEVQYSKSVSSYFNKLVISCNKGSGTEQVIRTVTEDNGLTTDYVFQFTSEEVNSIYSKLTDDNLGVINNKLRIGYLYFRLYTYTDSSMSTQIGGVSEKSIYAGITDYIPTISATLIDVNATSVALTGNNSKLINSISTARVTPTVVVQKQATISSFTINNVEMGDGAYLDFENSTATSYVISLTDSRNINVTYTFQSSDNTASNYFTLINYIPLTITATASRTAPTTGEVTLEYSGNVYVGQFQTNISNTLSLTYKYREKGQEVWVDGSALTYITSGSSYYGSANLSNFNYQKQWEIIIYATDGATISGTAYVLSSINSGIQLVPKGQPIFWWDDDGVYVNGNLKKNNNNVPSVKTNYDTSSTDTYSCDYINNMLNFMSLSYNSHSQNTTSWQNSKVTNAYLLNSYGDKLTFNSAENGIVIGADVTYVEVSARICFGGSDVYSHDTNLDVYRYRNGTGNSVASIYTVSKNQYWTGLSISTTIIEVQEGDILALAYSTGGISITRTILGDTNTSLLVKVIK